VIVFILLQRTLLDHPLPGNTGETYWPLQPHYHFSAEIELK
jgi:hypothetical protein